LSQALAFALHSSPYHKFKLKSEQLRVCLPLHALLSQQL
jgi:hypothetical protein